MSLSNIIPSFVNNSKLICSQGQNPSLNSWGNHLRHQLNQMEQRTQMLAICEMFINVLLEPLHSKYDSYTFFIQLRAPFLCNNQCSEQHRIILHSMGKNQIQHCTIHLSCSRPTCQQMIAVLWSEQKAFLILLHHIFSHNLVQWS